MRPTPLPAAPPPYATPILDALRRGDRDVETAFGRHLHWGYWGAGDVPDGSLADYDAAAERLSRRICDTIHIGDGQRVLDAGCGLGGTVASLNERFSSMALTGLNIDERQLQRARQQVQARPGNRVDFVHGDACRMPFPDGAFDAVLAVECIFHFPDRARFLEEVRRVLRPGGRLVISDAIPTALSAPLVRLQTRLLRPVFAPLMGRIDVSCGVHEYKELARNAGLQLASAEDITDRTLGTYPALRRILRSMEVPRPLAAGAVTALEWVYRSYLLRYAILSFRREKG